MYVRSVAASARRTPIWEPTGWRLLASDALTAGPTSAHFFVNSSIVLSRWPRAEYPRPRTLASRLGRAPMDASVDATSLSALLIALDASDRSDSIEQSLE